MQCLIQQFDTVEQDGTRDLYFTLNLLEYRPIEVPNLSGSNTNSNSNNTQNTSRPNEVSTNSNNQQKTHKVVKGDTLYDIAKKYYGNGNLYPKIKEANKTKYPSLTKNNIIQVKWELIIP